MGPAGKAGTVVALAVAVMATVRAGDGVGVGPVTRTGLLLATWEDPARPDAPPILTLADDRGRHTPVEFAAGVLERAGGLARWRRARVTVRGDWVRGRGAGARRLRATRLVPEAAAPDRRGGAAAAQLAPAPATGTVSWISLLCRFPDDPDGAGEPHPVEHYAAMYGADDPGLDHYWQEASYGALSLAGSGAAGWFTLPNPRAHYMSDREDDGAADPLLHQLAQDCVAAADAAVDFTPYAGIALFFNASLGCCAHGGDTALLADGVRRSWPALWLPPWGAQHAIVAHEMGHAFGLPHSSGMYGQTYDNYWDVMSDPACGRFDAAYGCVGQGTIGYHKDVLGWVPPGRVVTAAPPDAVSVVLERLAQPGGDGPLVVTVPHPSDPTRFHTVEVRDAAGYDASLSGTAVVIHEVVTTRLRPANVVDIDRDGDTSDAGSRWLPGEAYVDVEAGLAVSVGEAPGAARRVSVRFDHAGTPQLTSVTPAAGPVAGGTALTLRGAHFVEGATMVQLGEQSLPVEFVDESTLRAVTPPQEGLDTLRVRVTTLGGTASLANAFTYADQAISVVGGTVPEGDAGTDALTFEVALAQPAASAITVRYTTADGTARAATDFLPRSGVLNFDPGEQVKRLNVQVVGETLFERDETLALVLSAPTGAVIALPTATGTILDDDAPPLLDVGDVEVVEGEGGAVAAVRIALAAPSGLPAAVWLATEDGTATAGSDFDSIAARLEIPAGETSASLAIPIRGDRVGELPEAFRVAVSDAVDCRLVRAAATIVVVDDDEPRVVLLGLSVPEPAEGDTPVRLGVRLSNPSTLPVSVGWFTGGGTAQAGTDYEAGAGMVEFVPGETEGTIAVLLRHDTTVEPNETFSVTLSQSIHAAIETGTGVVVVLDDDVVAPGTWVVSRIAGEAGACGSNDGPGPAARLCEPGQITMGGNAALYLADTGNHVVRALASDGSVVTLAGAAGVPGDADGAASEARFNGPRGVARSADGTLYVADTGNHTIRAVHPDGTVVTLAGLTGVAGTADGPGPEARFSAPSALALNGLVLYVADTGNHAIRAVRIDDATVATVAGLAGEAGEADGTAAEARFQAPAGIAAGPDRTLVVADTGNHTLRIVSLDDGQVRTLAGVPGEAGDADGIAAVARFRSPTGVAVDAQGLVLLADTGNHVVRSVEGDGTVVTLAGVALEAGSTDGAGSGARFDRPASVALAPGAPVAWVTDGGSHVIRRMAPFARAIGTLELAPVAGVYGGTVALSARLLGGGVPLAEETVAFTLAGQDVGVATTDADGVARLAAVALGTLAAGTLPEGVRAAFAGSAAVDPASATEFLTVARGVPTVTWEPAASVPLGTPIGPAQLNASAAVPGIFVYTPPAGTILPLGPGHELRLLFTPDDLANHEPVSLARIVAVVPPPFSISLPPRAVAGCTKASGKVRLASPAPPGGFVFHLSSSDASVSLPATVTLAAGQLTKGFAIITTPVAAPVSVTVEAALGGVAAAGPLLVRPMAVRTLALTPNPVVGGATVAAVATLECQAGPGPVVVVLSSSKPGTAAPAQDALEFAEGTRTASFTVTTTPVAVTTKATIRAARGGVTRTGVLTVGR